MDTTLKSTHRESAWKRFVVKISLLILIFTLGVFIGVFNRNKKLINRQILSKARSHFHSIVLTRRWNADYGGVFIEKKEGIESNPYLKNPDIETVDGRIFTKKNPALMTREISDYAVLDSLLLFHMTSLKPINPVNAPDSFEKESLQNFENGMYRENYIKETRGGNVYFRYIAPLYTEEGCLKCHAEQGYKVGDIRGGISVSFDITETERELAQNKNIIVGLSILSTICLLGIIYYFTVTLMRKLEKLQKEIERLAVTDVLTGSYNRRFLYLKLNEEVEKSKRYDHDLSCVILDIDFFKKVNDTYGHIIGDKVLKQTVDIIKANCRTSDIVARYGGEEFVILLPETNLDGSYTVSEKIRKAISSFKFSGDQGKVISISVSLGVYAITPKYLHEITTIDNIIKNADDALLQAKNSGRDRTIVYGREEKDGESPH
ncbi:diguanylate cyclase [Candidatus Omnitrophota bacterium]